MLKKSELNRSALVEQLMNKVIQQALLFQLANFTHYAKPPNKVSAAMITKKNNTFSFTSFIMQVAS